MAAYGMPSPAHRINSGVGERYPFWSSPAPMFRASVVREAAREVATGGARRRRESVRLRQSPAAAEVGRRYARRGRYIRVGPVVSPLFFFFFFFLFLSLRVRGGVCAKGSVRARRSRHKNMKRR